MTNMEIVTTAFNAEIERVFSPKEDIKNFLLSHERKSLCIENLLKEIRIIELGSAIKLTHEKIADLGTSFALSFAKLSLEFIERQNMTRLQKGIEKNRIEEDAYFEKLFAEEITEVDRSEEV